MKKSIGFCVVASFVSAVVAVCRGSEPVAAEALAGVGGYGETGVCIQDPGCEAGAYVYAGSYPPLRRRGALSLFRIRLRCCL